MHSLTEQRRVLNDLNGTVTYVHVLVALPMTDGSFIMYKSLMTIYIIMIFIHLFALHAENRHTLFIALLISFYYVKLILQLTISVLLGSHYVWRLFANACMKHG